MLVHEHPRMVDVITMPQFLLIFFFLMEVVVLFEVMAAGTIAKVMLIMTVTMAIAMATMIVALAMMRIMVMVILLLHVIMLMVFVMATSPMITNMVVTIAMVMAWLLGRAHDIHYCSTQYGVLCLQWQKCIEDMHTGV